MTPWGRRIRSAAIPAALGIAVFALLAAAAGMDPARGVTLSGSPFTDEAWNVLNARNFVVLGRWATDDWNRQLVSVPFSLLHVLSFEIGGVGIVQARLVEITIVALLAALLVAAPRGALGTWPAVLGAVALSTCALVLYYGRLVYLEPLTALGLTITSLTVVAIGSNRAGVAGVAAGVAVAVAIGTKLLALPDALGIVGAVLIVGIRLPSCRQWFVGLVVGLGICTIGWGILVWLPNRAVIDAVARTWPPEPLPTSLGMLLNRIRAYAAHNDQTYLLSAPLLIGAGVGVVTSVLRWHALETRVRLLFAAGLGWTIAGLGLLAIVPYAPNRYVVPTLPALALLVMVGAHAATAWLPKARRRRLVVGGVLGVAAALLLAGQGFLSYVRWNSQGTTTLPAVQAHALEIIPTGATIEGPYAPLFAMRVHATTIITNFGANPGDLYVTRNVRWFVDRTTSAPPWAAAHPDVWSTRRAVLCASWGGVPVCVYTLP